MDSLDEFCGALGPATDSLQPPDPFLNSPSSGRRFAHRADVPPITVAYVLDGKDSLAHSFGIDGLVKIDPQYAGKESNGWRERQEQHDGPQDDFRNPPTGQK